MTQTLALRCGTVRRHAVRIQRFLRLRNSRSQISGVAGVRPRRRHDTAGAHAHAHCTATARRKNGLRQRICRNVDASRCTPPPSETKRAKKEFMGQTYFRSEKAAGELQQPCARNASCGPPVALSLLSYAKRDV